MLYRCSEFIIVQIACLARDSGPLIVSACSLVSLSNVQLSYTWLIASDKFSRFRCEVRLRPRHRVCGILSDGCCRTTLRQHEETLKRFSEEGAEPGSSCLPRTQRRRFRMDGCGRQFASERIQQGQSEAFQSRTVSTSYKARSERTGAIRHTNKRE